MLRKTNFFGRSGLQNLITGLSVLFFAVSCLITVVALFSPHRNVPYQNGPEDLQAATPSPELKAMLGKVAREQEANSALIGEMQATIAKLEEKLSQKAGKASTIAGTAVAPKKAHVLAVLDGGSFGSGQAVISENLMDSVKALAPDILRSPESRVLIEGNTDNKPIRTSDEKQYRDNIELSFLRAKAVALILEKYGVPAERISVIANGDTRPVAPNETEEGRAKNRRVEVKLTAGEGEF